MSTTTVEISFREAISQGIPEQLPQPCPRDESVSHAPKRNLQGVFDKEDEKLALQNALRYFPQEWHNILAREFLQELRSYGRIYMYRFRPRYAMHARPIDEYPAQCAAAASIMLMIQNNLDPVVAKHPHELITYGGNGAVFQNWAQYLLCMKYLSQMTEYQTLVMYSGHPLGLFPSHPKAPRVVVTNGMMIPNHSSKRDWNYYNALGVTQYGQMTAGSYMYIGPQGIVHGTTITLLNAGRMLDSTKEDLRGKLFVTSGLGGMSGAQALAGVITGAVTIIGEIDPDAVDQRVTDGYIVRANVYTDAETLISRAQDAMSKEEAITLIYQGNIVALWEALAERNIEVHLGSDQTSLHNIDDLGYCPIGYSFEEAASLLSTDKEKFLSEVRATLRRHVNAINTLSARGMYFWDYGNAFLKEAGEAEADIWKVRGKEFKYPSYVEDIMGPLCFDYGFGPYRWVCCSGTEKDLYETDKIAEEVLLGLYEIADEEIKPQLRDNIKWIQNARIDIPIVGSKSRILYADAVGRVEIALAMNAAIRSGRISAPIVLGRDHHDVSGTDSPYRETANIYDGSRYTADMAVHNVIGDSFRGATWVSLHNGGGVGWGEVINGGFGMCIDGTEQADQNIKMMLSWDVNNGIARRSWARNPHAVTTAKHAMSLDPHLTITIPEMTDESFLDNLLDQK